MDFAAPSTRRKALDSVLVSSDRERNRFLFNVSIAEEIRVFRAVGNNDPNVYRSNFNNAKGDYDVVIKTERRGENTVQG